jgi:hypothetical protein
MQTETPVATNHGTLQVQWNESSVQQLVGIQAEQIADEIRNLALFVSISAAIAKNFKPDADNVFERTRPFDPTVRRVQFGSPLFIELDLAREITEGTASLAFLAYALKRAWGFDLEIKTHREEMRKRFLDAKRRADRAEKMIERSERGKGDTRFARSYSERVAQGEKWGQGAIDLPISVRRLWDSGHAEIRIDDED